MTVKSAFSDRLKWVAAALALAIIWAGSNVSTACTTPVYRYAMYRWFPAPYTVFYFHKADPSEADLKLHKVIEQYGDYEKQSSANIDLVPIDLNKDPELKRLPPFLRKAWQENNDGKLPGYMVISPLGDTLHRGQLDAAEIKAMLESPARTEIMKMLKEGKTCVYVMLTSTDKKQNATAEKAVRKAIKAVNSGEIEFYDGELPYFPEDEEEEEAAKPKTPKHSIGLVKLDRDNKVERWLVRALLSVEYDLEELDRPMIFSIFGRGRAFPPYVGKGVTYNNMLDYFAEVTGACSCTVKDQNPGIDLPMLNNWDAVAEAMANRYGAEEGNEGSVADLFPQLVVPGERPPQAEPGQPAGDGEDSEEESPPEEESDEAAPSQEDGESQENGEESE